MTPILLFVGLFACTGDVDPVTGTGVIDDLSTGFWSAPFPSDQRLTDDGTVDLTGFPNPDDVPFVAQVVELMHRRATGFGTTSTVYFPLNGAVDPESLPTPAESLLPQATVYLEHIQSGARVPVYVHFDEDAGPFGTRNLLGLLPVQGVPMSPGQWRAVVTTGVLDADGQPLLAMDESMDVAGETVFTASDPVAEQQQMTDAIRALGVPSMDAPVLTETFDDFCVYESSVDMPVYQEGEPPFQTQGGTLAMDVQRTETARILFTVPRAQMPAGGWPTAVFVRTGGGGDRPLVERGVRDGDGLPVLAGSGPARDLAWGGYAGVSVDGPHGGLRNITGGDEQFLMFNVANPGAMLGNVRQSALELTLVPDVLDGLSFDTSDCADGSATASFDADEVALIGHSMGATIAPLVITTQPAYKALVLSGAGGSWLHNIVYKQKPLNVRPLAETMLQYGDYGRELHPHDPALMMLQWAGESADPPVYAKVTRETRMVDVLMHQGIVDRYILPPIANATSLAYGLDLAGGSLDAQTDEIAHLESLEQMLQFSGGEPVDFPVQGNRGEQTAVVVQHIEDEVEDGHEVMFQLQAPKRQYRCFLQTRLVGPAVLVDRGAEDAACD